MFPKIGDRVEPCAVPSCGSVDSSPSRTPTGKHWPTSRMNDSSATRCRSISINLVRSKLSKKDRMSASSTQFIGLRITAASTARSASCALRPGRKPYEQSKKSCS